MSLVTAARAAAAAGLFFLLAPRPATAALSDQEYFFCEGYDAGNFGLWKRAAVMFSEAIRVRDKAGGPKMQCDRIGKWYVPHYYLGTALMELGYPSRAFDAWLESARQGQLRKSQERDVLRWARNVFPQHCTARLARERMALVDLEGRLDRAEPGPLTQSSGAELLRQASERLREAKSFSASLDETLCREPTRARELPEVLAAGKRSAARLDRLAELRSAAVETLDEASRSLRHERVLQATDQARAESAKLRAALSSLGSRPDPSAPPRFPAAPLLAQARPTGAALTRDELMLEKLLTARARLEAGWCVPTDEVWTAIRDLHEADRMPETPTDLDLAEALLLAARNCYERQAMDDLLHGKAPPGLGRWLDEALGDVPALTTFEAWLEASAPLEAYDRSYALLVGASQYGDRRWNQLPEVETDLRELEIELRRVGFEPPADVEQPLLDPTGDELETAVTEFLRKHGPARDTRLLIYWAGHGYDYSLPDGPSLGYLVPADAPWPEDDFRLFDERAIDFESFRSWFTGKHAPVRALILLDSCHSGKVVEGGRQSTTDFDRSTVTRPARVFIASGAREVPAGSRFRKEVVDALRGCADRDRNRHLTGSELAHFLEVRLSKPSPEWAKGATDGDFVFQLERPAERVTEHGGTPPCPLDSPHLGDEERRRRGELEIRLGDWEAVRDLFLRTGRSESLETLLALRRHESIFGPLAARILQRVGAPVETAATGIPSTRRWPPAPLRSPCRDGR